MAKKCKKCGVPLSGWIYKFITKPIAKVEPSKREKGVCNKCEVKSVKKGKKRK